MMSLLTRKHAEAKRLLELYVAYKDCKDDWRRRKAHIDLDRFLMENRETAIMCIEKVLQDEIDALVVESRKHTKVTKVLRPSWFRRLTYSLQRRRDEGGVDHDGALPQQDATTRDA